MLSVLYDWGGANREIFLAINGLRGPVVDTLMLAGSHLGDTWNAAWISLTLVALIAMRRVAPAHPLVRSLPEAHWTSAMLKTFLAGFALTALIVGVGKVGFGMPRPYVALVALPPGTVTVLAGLSEPYSLPSGHAALAMLVAWTLWPHCPLRWRAILVLCVLWVGLARISLGAHFPADVLAGYLCGAVSGWLASGKAPGRRAVPGQAGQAART